MTEPLSAPATGESESDATQEGSVVRARRPFLARRHVRGALAAGRRVAGGADRSDDASAASPATTAESGDPSATPGDDDAAGSSGPGGTRAVEGSTSDDANPSVASTDDGVTPRSGQPNPSDPSSETGAPGDEGTGSGDATAVPAPPQLTPADIQRGWQADLASSGLQNTLLHANQAATTWLDLTHAHPSGLAQLMAGRPTRLSSLVREAAAHATARRRARSIRARAAEIVAERGVRSGFLAAGIATWRPGPLRVLELEASSGAVQAPVLLRGCTLKPRGAAHEDYDVDLEDDVIINPELLRRLGSEHAVRPDGAGLASLAFGQSGFDPRPVFDLLEELCATVPGFEIERSLLLGTFTAGAGALIADVEDVAPALETHPVLSAYIARACAADASAVAVPDAAPDAEPGIPSDPRVTTGTAAGPLTQATTPSSGASPAPSDPAPRRDPRFETLQIFDLDPAQQRAVDAVITGASVSVEGPPGTGVTHTLAASAAAMVTEGRRVLVVTARRSTADAFAARLAAAGLPDLVLDLQDGAGKRRALLGTLGSAVGEVCSGRATQAASAPPQFTAHLLESMRSAGTTLTEATEALHSVREPWGVSAYQAMVELAGLMARPEPPSTRVRLPLRVLSSLDATERERLRGRLHDAAKAGAFTVTLADTAWAEADLRSDDDANKALSALDQAIEQLQRAEKLMGEIARAVGLARATRVRSWRPQLDLLIAVRTTLDRLLPAVYEQPLGGFIAVLDPDGAPEAEGGQPVPDLGGRISRMSLRRRAKALVRPGVHVPDLHDALVAAAAERIRWNETSEGGGWPRVPAGLAEAEAAVAELERALAVLDGVFGRPPGGGEASTEWREGLAAMPLPDLRRTLRELQKDPAGARRQPPRAVIMDELAEAGLGALLGDLRLRFSRLGEGATVRVDGELDLAWWASVLEAIIRSDARLARHDGDTLRRVSAEYRLADAAALRDGARRLRARLAERGRRAAEQHPEQAAWLQQQELAAAVETPSGDWPRALLAQAGDVVAALRPIWIMSPDAVARLVSPLASGIDVVIADDAGQVPTAEAVAALARGRQIVLGGDCRRVPPQRGLTSVLEDLAPLVTVCRLDRDHRLRDGRIVAPVLSQYPEGWSLTPGTSMTPALTAELVAGGIAVAAPGEQLPLSPDAEVQRVVELILEHTRRHPDESLMVLTLGERHAQRIEETLRVELPDYPDAGNWLRRTWTSGGGEPFVVRPVAQALGLERDAVIMTVGIGRTPHGRVLHRFGELDTAAGPGTLISAVTRARLRTTVVACFAAHDLDQERLKTDGGQLLREILAAAADRAPLPGARLTAAEAAPHYVGPDALVADLRDRLIAAGVPAECDPEAIPVADGWPVDLVIGDPRVPGRRLVAVDLDGPSYAARDSLRDRERLRRERFERAGWTYCKVAVMDVFLDPQNEVRRIADAWHAALGDPEAPLTPPSQDRLLAAEQEFAREFRGPSTVGAR